MSALRVPLLETAGRRPSIGNIWTYAGGPARHEAVARAADRIARRGGDRFFVSGYAGVGKSLFLRQVIHELRFRLAAEPNGGRCLFHVDLTGYNLDDVQLIGRQLTLGLHWEVERAGLSLGRAARQRLLRAVEGVTTRSVEKTRSLTEEIRPQIEVSTPIKLGLGAGREERAEEKAVFEGYNVPTTLMELGSLLRELPASITQDKGGFWRFLGLAAPLPRPLMVVTIDRIASWDVLRQLADLFTARETTFLVVVPLAVRARWLASLEAGQEEIPAFRDVYVPCIWEEMEPLVGSLISAEALPADQRDLPRRLAAWLGFMGNGIPRRVEDLLFNHLSPDADGPALVFSERDLADIDFCAELWDVIRRRERDIVGELVESVARPVRDQFRRIAIDTARQFVSRGVIRLRDYSHTVMVALETIPEDERERIVRRVIEVLKEEQVAAPTPDGAILSDAARAKIGRGHTVLVRAHLPPVEGAPPVSAAPADRAAMAPPRGAEPPPTGGFGDQVREMLVRATEGTYQVVKELGRGGMSIVYRARDLKLARDVAIKVLPPSLTVDAATIERFRGEARTAAGLNHPNIVPIYAIGDTGPLVWFSMMYVDGPSLADRIAAGPPAHPAVVVELLQPIAHALDYAHSLGVVHRDIKPSNLMLGRHGQYLLLDFGIAKALSQPDHLTGTGMAIGTPRYMAPEQARARPVSPATDQFALAVIAYELLTGTTPFEAGEPFATMQRLVTEEPQPVNALNAALSAATAEAVAKALAKDPTHRYPGAGAFLDALAGTVGS